MAVIKQQYLPLDWDEIDDSPDLERVKMVLDNLPDESLMRKIGSRRMGRPDATPVRVKWNCLLAGRVLGHRKMSALLAELRRNGSLRRVVGIHPAKGWKGVPDKDEMSRFWKKLVRHFKAFRARGGEEHLGQFTGSRCSA